MARTGRRRRLNGFFHAGALSAASSGGTGEINADPAVFAGTGRERFTGTAAFVAVKAALNGFGKNTGTGAFVAAPAVLSGFSSIGVAPHLTVDRQGPRAIPYRLPGVAWTVGDVAVRMYDASWSTAWDGGFDQMRGALSLTDLDRTSPVQGTMVRAFTTSGACVFEGRLSTPPQIADGMAHLAGQGLRVKAQQKVARLFIQSRDMDLWTTTDSDPHLLGNGDAAYGDSDKIAVNIQGGVSWRLNKDTLVANSRENGVICYLEGVAIKRVTWSGRWEDSDNRASLTIRIGKADGPIGPATFLTSFVCNSANRNDIQDVTIATPADQVLLMLHTLADITPNENLRYQAQKIRVNSSIETGDDFTGSQIVTYIGEALNWDTSEVTATTDNALPFDWQDGSWADALTYVAETDDRYWRLTADRGDGPVLTYDDWGSTEWTAYLSRGCVADIQPEEQFNQVWVWYDTPKGIRRRAVITPDDIGEDDPLGSTNVYEYELNDRQSDAAFANRVGNKLLRRVLRPRHSGSLDCSMLFDEAGASRPYEALAGDTVRIADWGPSDSLTLRIVQTDASASGVRLGVERPINLDGLLERHRKRKRGRNA